MRHLRIHRTPVGAPGRVSLRHQVTVGDDEAAVLRRVLAVDHRRVASLLAFRYGIEVSPWSLSRVVEAGGDVLLSAEGAAVYVPAADAARLLGSDNVQLRNLGGVVAMVAPDVEHLGPGSPDEEVMTFQLMDLNAPRDAQAARGWLEHLAVQVKGHYYGYLDSDMAQAAFAEVQAPLERRADRYLMLVNGLMHQVQGERLTLAVADHFPVGRHVPETLCHIARHVYHDGLDYRLLKRGLELVGEWGFFGGDGVTPVATAALYTR